MKMRFALLGLGCYSPDWLSPPYSQIPAHRALMRSLLALAVWLSFWLRLADPFHPSFMAAGSWLLLAVLLVGLPSVCIHGAIQRPHPLRR